MDQGGNQGWMDQGSVFIWQKRLLQRQVVGVFAFGSEAGA